MMHYADHPSNLIPTRFSNWVQGDALSSDEHARGLGSAPGSALPSWVTLGALAQPLSPSFFISDMGRESLSPDGSPRVSQAHRTVDAQHVTVFLKTLLSLYPLTLSSSSDL